MAILITLKTIEKGQFKVKIKHENGVIDYKELNGEELFDFLQSCDFYCETHDKKYKFIIPDGIKKMADQWIKTLATSNNNDSDT